MTDFYVYLITGPKKYVGITSRTPRQRWADHLRAVQSGKNLGSRLHAAIRKYGKEAFTVEELAKCATWEDVCELEQEFIAEFDTYENGYNATRGGEGTHGLRQSEDWCRKQSERLRGKKRPASWGAAISAAKKGMAAPEHIYSEQFRAKISAAHKGKKRPDEWKEKIREGVRRNWELRRARAQALSV